MDIASLAIQINTSDVARASRELDNLSQRGVGAESAAKKVGSAWRDTAGKISGDTGEIVRQLRALNGSQSAALAAFERMAESVERHNASLAMARTTLSETGAATRVVSAALDGVAQSATGVAVQGRAVSSALANSSNALNINAGALERAGLSAGQYQQAIRMLPMQLTDVVTSLASGMPLWMVAIQQGGQVRDSFGGIGNAARAVVSTLGPMNLAIGGVAAMLGTLLLAYESGRSESERFNRALIMTGNSAGLTSDHLAGLAREMDMMSGVTTSSAADALAKVAETGRFTGEQIRLVATAAEQMRDATGRSVDETVKEFLRLRADPVKAILELNDQYHFLSESQLEQIESLQDQGKQQAAVTEAMRIYANVIAERTPQITENLGWIEKAWRAIQRGASETIDDIRGIGRDLTAQERINDLLQKRNILIANQDRILMSDSQRRASQAQIDAYNAEIKALQDAEVERQKLVSSGAAGGALDSERRRAADEWERRTLRYASDRKKLEEEIKEIRTAGLKAGIAQPEIDAQIAAATKQFEERQARANRPRAYTDDAATRMLQQLREQGAALQAQLAGNDKLTAAQRAQVEWAQQLADLKQKGILTAEQKSLLANQDTITTQLAENAALEAQIQLRERLAEQAQWMATLQERVANRQNAVDIAVQGIGMGDRARRELEEINAVQREYARSREELARQQGTVNALPEDQFQARIEALRAAEEQEITIIREGSQRKLEAEADWTNGARRALENYLDDARNVAEITEDLFGSAFRGMEDAIAKFATTGKLEFRDFAQSVIADMLRISAQQAASEIGSSLISSLGRSALGSLFSGAAGSNISDYTGGSFDKWVAGRRAMGGPTSPGSLYEVNERGPELYVEKGRTYLMTGANSGYVSPMEASGKATAQGAAPIINIIEDASRAGQVSSRREDERWVTDVVVANLYQEGSVWQAISRMAGVDRKGT